MRDEAKSVNSVARIDISDLVEEMKDRFGIPDAHLMEINIEPGLVVVTQLCRTDSDPELVSAKSMVTKRVLHFPVTTASPSP